MLAPTAQIQVGADLASAYCGLGLVMEFLAHQIKATASGSSQVPVEITAIEVGPGERGREMISLGWIFCDTPGTRAYRPGTFSRPIRPFTI